MQQSRRWSLIEAVTNRSALTEHYVSAGDFRIRWRIVAAAKSH